jgi:hypothetical protein
MLNSKPPWYAGLLTRENLKKVATWLAVAALFVWLAWPDSREKELVREVNAKTAALIENFGSLTDEQIISELEAIKTLTDEPEPEHEDPE